MAAHAPHDARARRQLLLACARPEGAPADSRLAAAVAELDADPALRQAFEHQAEFDLELLARLEDLPLPADLNQRAAAQWAHGNRRRGGSFLGLLREPAFLAVVLAFSFLLAWAGWYAVDRVNGFPGDEALGKLLDAALPSPLPDVSGARAGRLHAAGGLPCGQLGDALFLQTGFDTYAVPPEFAAREAAGFRVLKRPGDVSVAQVALRGEDGMTLFVFHPADFGVRIEPAGRWKFLVGDRDRWAAVVQVREDGLGIAAVCPGDKEELLRRLAEVGLQPWELNFSNLSQLRNPLPGSGSQTPEKAN